MFPVVSSRLNSSIHTKLTNVHRISLSLPGRWNRSPPLSESPELNKNLVALSTMKCWLCARLRDNRHPVWLCVVIMCSLGRWAWVHPTNAFLLQKLTLAGNTRSKHIGRQGHPAKIQKLGDRALWSFGGHHAWWPSWICSHAALPISIPIADRIDHFERNHGQAYSPKEQWNDFTLCTLYRVFYSSEIRIPLDVSWYTLFSWGHANVCVTVTNSLYTLQPLYIPRWSMEITV